MEDLTPKSVFESPTSGASPGGGSGASPASLKVGGGNQQDEAEKLARLDAVLERFDISIADANDLVVLQDYEIVVIADDSGSMKSISNPEGKAVDGAKKTTRWDELKTTVSEIVEIASCFDESGIDVYFLNRHTVKAVKHATDERFVAAFEKEPKGSTPLTEVLERVARKTEGGRPVLIFILTDGEPDGGKWRFIDYLKKMLERCHLAGHTVRVQIMACTSEDGEVAWLNEVDAELAEVDVTDDYMAERKEVLAAHRAEKFTRGDWCMKAMLGMVSSKFDKWDEQKKRGPNEGCDPGSCRCSIQ